MPDRDWPPLHRRLARVVGAAAYACVAASGAGVIADPPQWTSQAALITVTVLAALALASGAMAAASVAAHNWHGEFVAAWFLAAPTAGFAAIVWAGGSFAGAALITSIPLFCVLRGVQLWVFSLDARRARRQRVSLWRRTASTEYHR